MIDMVGIGPFITIPLNLAAMGGGAACWLVSAACWPSATVLVTAELSAEMPASGGSYVFLRPGLRPRGPPHLLSLSLSDSLSAPLSMASGCIGSPTI